MCETAGCDRPPCSPHLCPAPDAVADCTCCGLCAKNCADIAELIATHSPLVIFERMEATLIVEYLEPEDDDDDDTL